MKNYSKQREVIKEVLCSTNTHPTVNWIYSEARKKLPNISLGTVYRNLAALQQEGIIREVAVGDGLQHFDGDVKEHLHFHCIKCGKILDCEAADNSIKLSVEKLLGCQVLTTNCVFNGVCNACKNK